MLDIGSQRSSRAPADRRVPPSAVRACEDKDIPVAAWHSSVVDTKLARTHRDLLSEEPYYSLLYTTPESLQARCVE